METLYDADLCAALGFAGEFALFDAAKGNDAGFLSVDGEVFAHVCTVTSYFCCTCLTNENFAGRNFLATKSLDAKSLTWTVMDVFA